MNDIPILMQIPNSFKETLKKKELRDKKREEEGRKQEKERQFSLEAHLTKEKECYPQKLELTEKIFTWKDEFLKTEEGQKLFQRGHGMVWVYFGKWGHELPYYNDYGCHSRIYFSKENISYSAGYKWFPAEPKIIFKQTEEMAEKLNYDYLDKLLDHLESGKVWGWLEKKL